MVCLVFTSVYYKEETGHFIDRYWRIWTTTTTVADCLYSLL